MCAFISTLDGVNGLHTLAPHLDEQESAFHIDFLASVTAKNKNKLHGNVDPALTYTYSGLASGDSSASFTGSLVRAPGEAIGSYTIAQNSLAANGNYTIGSLTPDTFTITIDQPTLPQLPDTFVARAQMNLMDDEPAQEDAWDGLAGNRPCACETVFLEARPWLRIKPGPRR